MRPMSKHSIDVLFLKYDSQSTTFIEKWKKKKKEMKGIFITENFKYKVLCQYSFFP